MHKLVAIVVAAAAVIVAFASLRALWYHDVQVSAYPTQGYENRDETQYSLDGLYLVRGDGRDFWSFEEGRVFWEPMEPIHSFMERLQILMTVGSVVAGLWALFVFFERRFLSVLAGLASASLFGVSPLIFFLGFGSVYSETDLPGYQPDFTEFFVNTTEESSYVVRSEVFGPMAGWWLAIAACGIMAAGMMVMAVIRRSESRTVRGTRPSRSP